MLFVNVLMKKEIKIKVKTMDEEWWDYRKIKLFRGLIKHIGSSNIKEMLDNYLEENKKGRDGSYVSNLISSEHQDEFEKLRKYVGFGW